MRQRWFGSLGCFLHESKQDSAVDELKLHNEVFGSKCINKQQSMTSLGSHGKQVRISNRFFFFFTADIRLVITGNAQVFLIISKMLLFYSSVPVSRDSVAVSQHEQ